MTSAEGSTSIRVRTERPYSVRVGPGVLAEVAAHLAPYSRCAVVTDVTVGPLHGGRLGLPQAPVLRLAPGETSKTLAAVEGVLDFLAEAGLDRRSCLVALGGGVVGDLAGLAASLYMRGIAVIHAPTTLLAQVDGSVGGKTAVNLRAGKNLAGTFHQPSAVFADTSVLGTLSADDFRSGLGEVVKTALLAPDDTLALVERRAPELAARSPDVLPETVARCVRVKADLVARDERDAGPRSLLNLGHTFGHAIEHAAGYGRVPHGLAVGVGLALALETSRLLGRLEDSALPERFQRLMDALGLPRTVDALEAACGVSLSPAALRAGLRHDKKGAAGAPRLVVLRAAGRAECGVEAPAELWSELPGFA